jgi:hypothetical protein
VLAPEEEEVQPESDAASPSEATAAEAPEEVASPPEATGETAPAEESQEQA